MQTIITETTVYTAKELQEQFPKGFDRALDDYAQNWLESFPWGDEEFESLKATIEAFGATIKDYSLDIESHRSYLRVSVDDSQDWDEDRDGEDGEIPLKDDAWALSEVLTPLGYAKDGKAEFPGLCKFTGYCADDDYMEAVYDNLKSGDTLTEALEDLARVYAKRIESEFECACKPEIFIETAEANEWQFTEDGETF